MSTLDAQAVYAAALSVVDTQGPKKLTMRAVASLLGVEAPSLYHHVPNKAALVDGIVLALLDQVDLPVGGLPASEATRAWAHAWRNVLDAHPNAVRLVGARPSLALDLVERSTATRADLVAAGIGDEAARDLLLTVLVFTLGQAELVHSEAETHHRDLHGAETWFLRGLHAIVEGFDGSIAAVVEEAAAIEEAVEDEEAAEEAATEGAAAAEGDQDVHEADIPSQDEAGSHADEGAQDEHLDEVAAAGDAQGADEEHAAGTPASADADEGAEPEPQPEPKPARAAPPPRPAPAPRAEPEPERRGIRGRLRGLLGRNR